MNTNIPAAAEAYAAKLEELAVGHRIIERMGQAHETSESNREAKANLDRIDRETKDYMKGSERKCRRIKSGRIPFSPESSRWIRRAQVYRLVLRFHAEKLETKQTSVKHRVVVESPTHYKFHCRKLECA